MESSHQPVLLKETLDAIDPKPGETVVDGTLGGAGHSREIVKRINPDGKLIAFDRDPDAIDKSKEILQEVKDKNGLEVEVVLFQDNFENIPDVLKEEGIETIDGLLLDLGFSSDQVFSGKGFSYQKDEPLIMRYDGDVSGFTAARLLSEYSEKDLAEIIKKYGEERFADRIANSIANKRREESFRTTRQLVKAIKTAIPGSYESGIHPAARTFMAIRIFVNREIESLKNILDKLEEITEKGSHVAIISFHSLEDRLVKNKFKELVEEGSAEFIQELSRPTEEEKNDNPRSRSAKLRSIKFKK